MKSIKTYFKEMEYIKEIEYIKELETAVWGERGSQRKEKDKQKKEEEEIGEKLNWGEEWPCA